MATVSVIVPVYKVEKYLKRCVDSVFAQTFEDFELILVDDGSPDGCPALCDEIAKTDDRVRVIHKKNGGLSDARNAGIDVAGGKYLFFLDSDDVIHQNTLEILLCALRRSSAQIAGGGFARFEGDKPSDELTAAVWNHECESYTAKETLGMYFDGRESLHSVVSSCCKLYCRELFDDIRFPVGRLFEDEFTIYKVYYKAKTVAFTEMPLYYYFVNDSGITGTLTLQKRFDEYDAQWERLAFFEEEHLTELYDKALYEFLRTAKWDLVACRDGKETADADKKARFLRQCETVFDTARKRKLLEFARDYDYYVLVKPRLKLWWRVRRLFSRGK